MLSETYVQGVLAVAPSVVCLAWSADGTLGGGRRLMLTLLSALLFGASLFVPALLVWGVLPWLLCCLERAGRCLWDGGPPRTLAAASSLAALLYLPVGSIWALFHEVGFHPLGFSGIIVLLTGVHFHYAGFALPWLTGRLLAMRRGGRALALCALGVIAGVPLVAIGITSSQLGLPVWVETLSVTILACSAFGISYGYLAWSGDEKGAVRACFLVGGLALALGMVLALFYGWRAYVPLAWVTIPAMYSLHGMLNSLGFCLPCILGNKLLGGGGGGAR